MGCLGVGETARGEQLIANQGQESIVFAQRAKETGSPSKQKEGLSHMKGGKSRQE